MSDHKKLARCWESIATQTESVEGATKADIERAVRHWLRAAAEWRSADCRRFSAGCCRRAAALLDRLADTYDHEADSNDVCLRGRRNGVPEA